MLLMLVLTLYQNPSFLSFGRCNNKEHKAGDNVQAFNKENSIAVQMVTENC